MKNSDRFLKKFKVFIVDLCLRQNIMIIQFSGFQKRSGMKILVMTKGKCLGGQNSKSQLKRSFLMSIILENPQKIIKFSKVLSSSYLFFEF